MVNIEMNLQNSIRNNFIKYNKQLVNDYLMLG